MLLPGVPSAAGGGHGLLPKEDVSLLNFKNGFMMLKVVGYSTLWVKKNLMLSFVVIVKDATGGIFFL